MEKKAIFSLIKLPLYLLFFLLSSTGSAQFEIPTQETNESQAVIVKMNDGSVVYGYIAARTDDQVTITSISLGEITVPITEISAINYVDVKNLITDKNGRFIDFHNSTHHFFFPSGYSLRKGQSYYENIYIFYNSYTYGVTDNFSITAGAEVATLLFNSSTPLIFVSAKFSVPFKNDKAAFALNGTYIRIPFNNSEGFAILTGSLTLGSRNNNVTLGVGLGFNTSTGINDEVIPVSFSMMQRLSHKLSFVSENYIFIEDDFGNTSGIISAGLRIHFKDNGGAFNVGLFRPIIDDSFGIIAAPLVSATISIGK